MPAARIQKQKVNDIRAQLSLLLRNIKNRENQSVELKSREQTETTKQKVEFRTRSRSQRLNTLR
jgi:hypothetical protein